jgi:hypothetical protein
MESEHDNVGCSWGLNLFINYVQPKSRGPLPPKGSLNYLKRVTLKNLVYNITWPVLSLDIHSMIAGFSWTSNRISMI